MAGVTGLRPNITHVSLRCSSLGHISDALAYAGSVCGGEKGVVVIGLDVLLLYSEASLCVATAAEAARFDAALLAAMTTDDLLVVMPSGNYDVHGPAALSQIPAVPASVVAALIVGAVDQAGTARWNNPTNGASRFGPGLSMVAPGDNIYTSYDTTLTSPDYGQVFGTSFAAAHVAGIAALTRSAHSTMSAIDVKAKILGSCSWPVTGFASEVGGGLVDGAAAVI
jgi:subtilisin family serine protease